VSQESALHVPECGERAKGAEGISPSTPFT
jgi:hypothetical protein